jgi:hypothetical protein
MAEKTKSGISGRHRAILIGFGLVVLAGWVARSPLNRVFLCGGILT